MPGTISRRHVLSGAAAAPFLLAGCGSAETARYRFRLATSFPAYHSVNKWFERAADAVRRRTGGEVSIQIFGASQLGSDTDRLAQLRAGAIHFNALSGGILSMLVPVAAVSNIGFAFSSLAQAFSAMDGELGQIVRAEISNAGLYAFPAVFNNGFRQITTSIRAIRTPGDLDEMKIRVPPGRLWTSMFGALGALPTAINFSETYSALQTHVVEGQENALTLVETAKLFEVQRFCSLTNHMWDGIWVLANQDAMRQLPDAFRNIILDEFGKAALMQRARSMGEDVVVARRLRGHSMAINSVDPLPFIEALRASGFYAEWRERLGTKAWSALESHSRRLA